MRVTYGVRGAGGGGGGSEQTDTLRAAQQFDILDLISEGECVGLVNGLKSVYFDGVPLQAADGSFNFDGVSVELTPGTQGQASIAGADGVQNEIAVSVPVPFATPIVRTITNAAVDHCRVTIVVPQLSASDSESGDLHGSSFQWAIEVESAGGGYVEVFNEVIDGKTMSSYPREVEFKLPGAAPWNIRVKRLSADSTSASVVNAFGWQSYAEIQRLKLRYPNSAMARTRGNAQQFSRIPVRSFDWMGMRIEVPTNYDPKTRVYTGVWDGTFKIAYTDNPVWQYRDMVVHNRYGLGKYIQTTDALKWELYAISRYCDGMVPDGYGGMEPRFRASPGFETREQAYKVLTDMAAIFRGMAYWLNSDVSVVQDAPSEPVAVFTPANVVQAGPGKYFTYSSTSNSKRYSQVVVWFNSLADRGKLVPEIVVDQALEARIGVKALELSPMGVWSRGQAQRIGKWVLYTQQYETEAVVFTVGLDGALVAPGKVFQIADPNEAGERLAGRVREATTTEVTLDAMVTLAPGESYTLTVMVQDPADATKLMTQKRAVSTAAGVVGVVTVAAAFSAAPAAESVWLLQSDAVEATSWRCIGVAEVPDTNTFTITAIAHAPEKYDLIEFGVEFEPRSVSRIRTVPIAPASLLFTETPYLSGSITRSRVTVSWPAPEPGLNYLVSWRLNGGPWTQLPSTSANSVEIDGLSVGVLEVTVQSRNALGNVSVPKAGSTTLEGKTALPLSVTGIVTRVVQGGVEFRWNASQEDDYLTTTIKIAGVIKFEGAASSWLWPWPALGTYVVAFTHWDTSVHESVSVSVTVVVDETVLTQWGQIAGRPQDAGNLVITPTFESGEVHGWGTTTAAVTGQAWTKALAVGARDNFEQGNNFPVRPGETLFAYADLDTSGTDFYGAFGFASNDASGAWTGFFSVQLAARTGSQRVHGSFQVPAGSVAATPWLQIGSLSGPFGTLLAANLYLGRSDLGATRNRDYLQYGDPAVSPGGITDGDRWLQTDAGGTVVIATYNRVGGAWVAGPAAAGLFTLVPRGTAVTSGGSVTKVGPAGWDSGAFTLEGYAGGAFCSFQAAQTDGVAMGALNTDPATNDSYDTLDHAWYAWEDSNCYIYESGSLAGSFGAYTVDTVFSIAYDNVNVRYLKDGVVVRTVPASAGLKFYFDSSIFSTGAALKTVRFGPQGAAGTNGIDGVGIPGTSSYVHIKYSNDGGATFTASAGEAPGAYLGQYVDSNPTDSSSVGAYTWSLIKGTDGIGIDGTSNYLHIKYSNDGGATFTGSGGEAPGTYIGQYVDSTLADSTSPGAYTWALIKGTDGTDGTDGVDAIAASLSSDSASLPADSTGVVSSFANGVTTMKVLQGVTDTTGSWTISKSDGSGVTSSAAGATVTVSAMSVDAGYVDVIATRSGYPTQTKRFTLVKARSAPSAPPVPLTIFPKSASTTVSTGSARAGIRINTDGTISTRSGASYNGNGSWYAPTTTGIGSSYWVKAAAFSGDPFFSGSVNTWQQVASALTYEVSTGTGSVQNSFTLLFSTAADDDHVVGSMLCNLYAERI